MVNRTPSPFDQIYAEQAGLSIEQYMNEKKINLEITREAERYIDTTSDTWPVIKINWDLAIDSQCFSLDGTNQKTFEEYYPNGFCQGWVSLFEFDKVLCHYSRRDKGELWDVGFKSKLAFLIVYLSKGLPISPPFVCPNSALKGQTILRGGHHRYAIAKEIGEKNIPIHFKPEDKISIENLMKVTYSV